MTQRRAGSARVTRAAPRAPRDAVGGRGAGQRVAGLVEQDRPRARQRASQRLEKAADDFDDRSPGRGGGDVEQRPAHDGDRVAPAVRQRRVGLASRRRARRRRSAPLGPAPWR